MVSEVGLNEVRGIAENMLHGKVTIFGVNHLRCCAPSEPSSSKGFFLLNFRRSM